MTQSMEKAYKTEYDKLFIGGKWVEPSTSEVIEVYLAGHRRVRRPGAVGRRGRRQRRLRGRAQSVRRGTVAGNVPRERGAVIGAAAKLIEERAELFKHLLTWRPVSPR